VKTTVALIEEPGVPFVFADVDIDEPRADEVLVRIVATGLCHTDLTVPTMLPAEMFPTVVGHEGAGVVEAVGDQVSGIEVGDHVVVSFRSCRTCVQCRRGDVGYCEQSLLLNYMGMRPDGSTTLNRGGERVFGSFFGQSSLARHALAYADNCIVVDKALDLSLLAPFACGFQTGAGAVLNVFEPEPGDSLAVFGAGAVGLAALAAARGAGVDTLVAVDPAPARRAAAARYGALAIDPGAAERDGTPSVVDQIKAHTDAGACFAIDSTALPAVVLQAQRALRTKGTLVALGLGAAEYTIDAIDLLQGGKVIRSTMEGEADPLTAIPDLIGRRAAGRFDVDPLVTTYPFAEIATAVAEAGTGAVIKPVLVWE